MNVKNEEDSRTYTKLEHSPSKMLDQNHKDTALLDPKLGAQQVSFLIKHDIFQTLAQKRKQFIERQTDYLSGKSHTFENKHMDVLKTAIVPAVTRLQSSEIKLEVHS